MTRRVRVLLDSFDQLSEPEQQEVVAQIIRRRKKSGLPPLTDEELILLAEERFLELDRREAAYERTRSRRGMAR